jgi:hypothetical protein
MIVYAIQYMPGVNMLISLQTGSNYLSKHNIDLYSTTWRDKLMLFSMYCTFQAELCTM